jgi:hypothetical protein
MNNRLLVNALIGHLKSWPPKQECGNPTQSGVSETALQFYGEHLIDLTNVIVRARILSVFLFFST